MKRASVAALFGLALASAGCPLATFHIEGSAGGAGSGGTGSVFPTFGGTVGVAGADVGAGRRGGSEPHPADDKYVIGQNKELDLSASAGPLANDTPQGLRVVASSADDRARPPGFDPSYTLGPDGSLTLTPAPDFFGVYTIEYTVETPAGSQASAKIEVRVVPTAITLESVAAGLGGYVLYGAKGAGLGAVLARAGDVNGDDLEDLLVGAPAAGNAFVAFGKSSNDGVRLTPLAAAAAELRYVSLGTANGEALGGAMAGLGDVDADGKADAAFAAASAVGRVYLVRGSELVSGVTLPTPNSVTFDGDPANVQVGRLLRGLADVSGDGARELLISATNAETGWAHIVTPNWLQAPGSPVTSAPGFHIQGGAIGDDFPLDAASVGDLDGDGVSEFITASQWDIALFRGGANPPDSVNQLSIDGSVSGWRLRRSDAGDASVSALGDVNGDKRPDFGFCQVAECRIELGLPATLGSGWDIGGFQRHTSRALIAGGGDLDGDGLADVALADASAVYIVRGRRVGFDPVDLRVEDSLLYRIASPSGGSIDALAFVGDVNGDGLGDLAIGDASADRGAGRAYVLFGFPRQ